MAFNTYISFFGALISWALAVFLGTQLLSGTFDGRECQNYLRKRIVLDVVCYRSHWPDFQCWWYIHW